MTHTEFVHQALIKLSFPGCRVWKQQTGTARAFDDPDRIIKFGIEGGGDISGIAMCRISGIGVRVEIECKVEKDKLRDSQIKFGQMILTMGGIYIECRNIDETVDQIKQFMNTH